MDSLSGHMIKELVLDFAYNGTTEAFAFQQEVNSWMNGFAPQLEALLNSVSGPGDVISIDQLVLELNLDAYQWKEQATRQIAAQLVEKFKSITTDHPRSSATVRNNRDRFGEIFLYYLVHGHLPWQYAGVASPQWDNNLREWVERVDPKFVEKLQSLLTNSTVAAQRFMQNIPFQTAVHLFGLLEKNTGDTHSRLLNDLTLLMKLSVADHLIGLKQAVYSLYMRDITASLNLHTAKKELLLLFNTIAGEKPPLKLIENIRKLKFQSPLLTQIQSALPDFNFAQGPQNETENGAVYDNGTTPAVLQSEQSASGDHVYITDAGLVLIAAFLPALFGKVGITENGRITDIDKAVCLTHFLATGSEKMNEFELSLSKVLCGIELNQVVDVSGFHLNTNLRNETDALLTSVIEYWSILKNTSVGGLRESFLKRNGKLSYNGRDWLLQVEQQSYDMLLEHLPWSYSMIKLPWMNVLLKTEWVG